MCRSPLALSGESLLRLTPAGNELLEQYLFFLVALECGLLKASPNAIDTWYFTKLCL